MRYELSSEASRYPLQLASESCVGSWNLTVQMLPGVLGLELEESVDVEEPVEVHSARAIHFAADEQLRDVLVVWESSAMSGCYWNRQITEVVGKEEWDSVVGVVVRVLREGRSTRKGRQARAELVGGCLRNVVMLMDEELTVRLPLKANSHGQGWPSCKV